MIFTPFAFMAETGPTWTPADIAKYWWTADAGVTIVPNNDVDKWTDQVSGKVMNGGSGAGQPEASPFTRQAALNNQLVIRFDGANRWLEGSPISFASDGYAFTCITITYKDNGATIGSALAQSIFFGSAGRFSFLSNGTEWRTINQGFKSGNTTSLENPCTTGVKVSAFEYDASGNVRTWFNDFNTPTSYSGGGVNQDLLQSTLFFGAYNDNPSSTPVAGYFWDGDIAEVIFVPSVLSAGDVANLQTYINTKYNLSV